MLVLMNHKRYRIGQLSRLSGLTERTIRYYDELGLLKTKTKTQGGQRLYSDSDLIYLKRIMELKALSFSLDEIKRIISLGDEDESGEKRRAVLLENYRQKLDDARRRLESLKENISTLEWHIKQLEMTAGSFKDCPGSLCKDCTFRESCSFTQD